MAISLFRNGSIKVKVILALILVVSVVFTANELYDYSQKSDASVQELNETANHTIVRLSETLELPLWELDEVWVENIIRTEMLAKDIYALVVEDEQGSTVGLVRDEHWRLKKTTDAIEGDYLNWSRPVLHDGDEIGVVSLYVTTEFVDAQLTESVRNNLLVTLLLMVLITLSLWMVLNRIIILPLKEILQTIKAISGGDYSRDVRVDKNDEMGKLADRFNAMKNSVHQREQELDHALEELKGRTIELTDTQIRLQQDVSERIKAQKETEAVRHYLKNIIDSMPSVLIGVNEEGVITQWNMEATQTSGIAGESAVGQYLEHIVPNLPQSQDLIRRAVQKRQPEKLVRITHPIAGQHYYADVVVYPLVGKDVMGAVIRIDDVTERVRMELLMTQTEKMMSIGGMAAGMAHELNNPLGGMLQGLQNIRRRLSPELKKNRAVAEELGIDLDKLNVYLQQRQVIHFMDSISEAGQRASEIVTNMLNFSRKPEIQVDYEALDVLLDRTLELASVDYDLKKKYDFRSIEIRREYEEGLTAVPCVASEIQQVLLNLLRNAAQALFRQQENTQPSITVRTVSRDEMACIEVEDNGPGIDEETRQRVFEPFFTTRPPGEGTGLGLSVSYFIMHDEHGGSISVESEPGKGARFIMCLPFESFAAQPVKKPEEAGSN